MPPLTLTNLAARAVNVAASEVAALMPGGHPYATPEGIYDRLMRPAADAFEPNDSSQAMRIGSHMEDSILRFAQAELGFKARINTTTFKHPTVRLAATPDAFPIGRMPWEIAPEKALIEVKMSGRSELWTDVPPYIEWQCRAQLACTGLDVVYIVVLAAMRLLTFSVERKLDLEDQMLERVDAFWRDHIVARVRPEPTVSAPLSPFSFEADPAIGETEAIA